MIVIISWGVPRTGDILGKFSHPHNVYLSMFYRNGLLGGGVFLVFLGYFTYLGLKHKSKWFVLSLFGWGALLTENNSLFTSPQPFWIYFWIPVFMTIVEVHKESVLKYLDNIELNAGYSLLKSYISLFFHLFFFRWLVQSLVVKLRW